MGGTWCSRGIDGFALSRVIGGVDHEWARTQSGPDVHHDRRGDRMLNAL
jgi:hypothetical protein